MNPKIILFVSFFISLNVFPAEFLPEDEHIAKFPKPAAIRAVRKNWFVAPQVQKWIKGQEFGMDMLVAMSQKLYKTGGPFIEEQRRAGVEKLRSALESWEGTRLNHIPHTSHQMWITRENQIPQTHIDATIQRCRSLGEGWTHILWVMDAEVLAPSITKLKEGLPDLEVRQVYDFYLRRGEDPAEHAHKVKMYGRGIFDGLLEGDSFVSATDILRKNVQYKASPEDIGGGLYADMGIRLLVNITPLLDRSDAAFYVQPKSMIFDMGLSAFKPGLPSLIRTLEVLDRVHEYDFPLTIHYQLGLIGSRLFHVCFAQECRELNVLPLMMQLHFSNANLSSSCKRNASLGNKTLGDVIRVRSIYKMAEGDQQE